MPVRWSSTSAGKLTAWSGCPDCDSSVGLCSFFPQQPADCQPEQIVVVCNTTNARKILGNIVPNLGTSCPEDLGVRCKSHTLSNQGRTQPARVSGSRGETDSACIKNALRAVSFPSYLMRKPSLSIVYLRGKWTLVLQMKSGLIMACAISKHSYEISKAAQQAYSHSSCC